MFTVKLIVGYLQFVDVMIVFVRYSLELLIDCNEVFFSFLSSPFWRYKILDHLRSLDHFLNYLPIY